MGQLTVFSGPERGRAAADPFRGVRAGRLRCRGALLPNRGPLGSRIVRLAQIRWAGFTG